MSKFALRAMTHAIRSRRSAPSSPATAIARGRVSHSWRFGQDRRLEMVRGFTDLDGALKHLHDTKTEFLPAQAAGAPTYVLGPDKVKIEIVAAGH